MEKEHALFKLPLFILHDLYSPLPRAVDICSVAFQQEARCLFAPSLRPYGSQELSSQAAEVEHMDTTSE